MDRSYVGQYPLFMLSANLVPIELFKHIMANSRYRLFPEVTSLFIMIKEKKSPLYVFTYIIRWFTEEGTLGLDYLLPTMGQDGIIKQYDSPTIIDSKVLRFYFIKLAIK